MSAWIVTISPEYPDHLDFAIEDGLWDTRRRAQISAGDEVFFWVSGLGLRALVDVTEGLRPLRALDKRARWHDRETGGYLYRFGLRVRKHAVVDRPWKQIQSETGITQLLSNGIVEVPFDALSVIRAYFGEAVSDTGRTDSAFMSSSYEIGMDMRARAMQEVVVRRGQADFRDRLLDAYGRCAVTGSEVATVLEAAHIDRYFGDNSHHVTNGLLLRSDIHTLFDAQFLTVDDNYLIRVSPRLANSEYAQFDGRGIQLPEQEHLWPDRAALSRHRASCRWATA